MTVPSAFYQHKAADWNFSWPEPPGKAKRKAEGDTDAAERPPERQQDSSVMVGQSSAIPPSIQNQEEKKPPKKQKTMR